MSCEVKKPKLSSYKVFISVNDSCQCELCKIIREVVARDEWRTTYANMLSNEADLLKKTISGEKQKGFAHMILHHFSFLIEKFKGR